MQLHRVLYHPRSASLLRNGGKERRRRPPALTLPDQSSGILEQPTARAGADQDTALRSAGAASLKQRSTLPNPNRSYSHRLNHCPETEAPPRNTVTLHIHLQKEAQKRVKTSGNWRGTSRSISRAEFPDILPRRPLPLPRPYAIEILMLTRIVARPDALGVAHHAHHDGGSR